MKSRWVALVLSVVALSVLGSVALFAAPATAAFAAVQVARCPFTPTPDNQGARPVLRPLPVALTRGTVEVTFHFNYGPVTVRLNRAVRRPLRGRKGWPGLPVPGRGVGHGDVRARHHRDGQPGQGTNGSEFFLVHSFAHIPAQYSVLGKVVRGMDAIDRMVQDGIIPADPNGPLGGAPKHPVKIATASFGR